MNNALHAPSKKAELFAFLFLTALLAPLLAVVGIGGYGLLVWLLQ